MAPAYEEAAKKLGEEGSKVILAKVDATVESAIAGSCVFLIIVPCWQK